jgi:hypothetical protein
MPTIPTLAPRRALANGPDLIDRLARVEPAIAGQHGDIDTFKVYCRIVRGFALGDEVALAVLGEWNARCEPPWTERELRDKMRRARRYGFETLGGLRRSRCRPRLVYLAIRIVCKAFPIISGVTVESGCLLRPMDWPFVTGWALRG